MAKRQVFICGICMHKYDPATVKLAEIGPRKKDVCFDCGRKAYGALCSLEPVKRDKTR